MSERAECVMLNKGPYIVKAVSSLADIVKRMEGHQYKKAPQLRTLHIAEDTLKEFDLQLLTFAILLIDICRYIVYTL